MALLKRNIVWVLIIGFFTARNFLSELPKIFPYSQTAQYVSIFTFLVISFTALILFDLIKKKKTMNKIINAIVGFIMIGVFPAMSSAVLMMTFFHQDSITSITDNSMYITEKSIIRTRILSECITSGNPKMVDIEKAINADLQFVSVKIFEVDNSMSDCKAKYEVTNLKNNAREIININSAEM